MRHLLFEKIVLALWGIFYLFIILANVIQFSGHFPKTFFTIFNIFQALFYVMNLLIIGYFFRMSLNFITDLSEYNVSRHRVLILIWSMIIVTAITMARFCVYNAIMYFLNYKLIMDNNYIYL